MERLTALKDLRRLALDHTSVDDDGLKRLSGLDRLESLYLRKTKISDAGLVHLGGLDQLTDLLIGENRITDAGLMHLQKLTNLSSLDLAGTAISDAGLRPLDPQRKLKALYLRNTNIGDASAAWLGERSDLQHLDLGGTQLTDAGLAKLAGLTNLEFLILAETSITDAGLAYLKPLSRLQRLDLSGTKIDDLRLEPLTALPALAEVNVRNTAVTAFDVLRALPQANRNVQRILAALSDKTELELFDQRLSDVVEYLKERHEIEIQLDHRSLDAANKNGDVAITFNYHDGTLNDGLKQMLARFDLVMAIRQEVLMIGAAPLTPLPSLPILPAGTRISSKLGMALVKPTELEFVDRPLRDVIEDLKARHGIDIAPDAESLTKVGLGADAPVTCNIKGISLKSALELLLGELHLTCYAEGDGLIVRPIQ
jgi:hypothetical protein